jgi:cell wall-associated NlpC family hydrolase
MVAIASLQMTFATDPAVEYQCQANLNLYDSPELKALATQAVAGRQVRILALSPHANRNIRDSAIQDGAIQDSGLQDSGLQDTVILEDAVQVVLCEDDYPGWVALEDLDLLERAEVSYREICAGGKPANSLSAAEIAARLPQVIEFAQSAMRQPNHYLWGGTVGPNYDCSGLVQTAFAAAGIWLPRDAYQQEAFVSAVELDALQPGDLVFFGKPERCTHVAIALGNEQYIHSSGKDQGRNGIGIDRLAEDGDLVSQVYFRQLRGAGRVVECYVPTASR